MTPKQLLFKVQICISVRFFSISYRGGGGEGAHWDPSPPLPPHPDFHVIITFKQGMMAVGMNVQILIYYTTKQTFRSSEIDSDAI